MTNIINMTPHAVHIVDAEGTIITTFPKGESMIRLAVKTVSAKTIAGVNAIKGIWNMVTSEVRDI